MPLQLSDPSFSAGYVEAEKYGQKLQHKQLGQLLCVRCHGLSNGAMIPAVEDFSQRQQHASGFASKSLVTPEELRRRLGVVRQKAALVVLLVDLLDCSGSMLGRVRELVGRNPIILVGTKADLLPAGTNFQLVEEWLQAAAAFKRISVVSVHMVSSSTGVGVAEAVAAIRVERCGRDVYVMGAANVGKSAFVRALIK
jgi:nitric-oxide synthase